MSEIFQAIMLASTWWVYQDLMEWIDRSINQWAKRRDTSTMGEE